MKILIFTIIFFLSISELLFSQYIFYNFPDVAEFKICHNDTYIIIRNLINNEKYVLDTYMDKDFQFINLFEKDIDQDNEMEYILIGACTAELSQSQGFIFDFEYATKPVCEFWIKGKNSSADILKYFKDLYYFIIPYDVCFVDDCDFVYQSLIYKNGKLCLYNENTAWEFKSLVDDNINSNKEYLDIYKDSLSIRNNEFEYDYYLGSLRVFLLQLLILNDSTNIEDIAKSYIDIEDENWLINNVKEKYQDIRSKTYEYVENLLYHNIIFPIKYIIKYRITKSTPVKLFITDSLENEIALLVNEEQVPGLYEVMWDAKDFPPGEYSYSIVTNEFTETQMLIRHKTKLFRDENGDK